jgi:hypothetical protein
LTTTTLLLPPFWAMLRALVCLRSLADI